MSQAVQLNEASSAHRSFHFQPPDPLWISSAAVDEARALLKDFDPRLNLWWSNARHCEDPVRPGRWRVVEWLKSQSNWSTATFVEGPNGEYRDPLPIAWLLEKLARIAVNTEALVRDLDEQNERASRKRRLEIVSNVSEYENDIRKRRMGVRQTFAPGHIRRRTVAQSDILKSNHAEYLRSLGLDPALYMR